MAKTDNTTVARQALVSEYEKHAAEMQQLAEKMAAEREKLKNAQSKQGYTETAPFVSNRVENSSPRIHDKSTHTQDENKNLIAVPTWSRLDFIKERLKFQKHASINDFSNNYTSGKSDPGFYFYKVFFNFNTGSGLFGSIISKIKDNNNAWQYLQNNIYGDKFSDKYRRVLLNKLANLEKFVKLLNFLTMECPWFFKEVSGLDEATKYNFNEIAKAENKKITIKFNQDAVDMRVSTLIDLYKDACFDYTNFKEVIPENLRKFDMSIILFNPPYIDSKATIQQIEQNTLETHDGGNSIKDKKEQNKKDARAARRQSRKDAREAQSNQRKNDRQARRDARKNGNTEVDDEPTDIGTASSFYIYEKEKIEYIEKNAKFDDISYKCIILKNCEILYNDLSSVPGAFSNLEPIKAELQMDISFERFYVYTVNYELDTKILDGLFNNEEKLLGDEDSINNIDKMKSAAIAEKYNNMKTFAEECESANKEMRAIQLKIDEENERHSKQVKALKAKIK